MFGPITVEATEQKPMFGPVTKAGETQPEAPQFKRCRQGDLEWARSNYLWLNMFADSEIKVNYGHQYPIVIVAEHPQVDVDPRAKVGVKISLDKRLPSYDTSPVELIELVMHGVEHPGTVIGSKEWLPGKISARSYAENQRGHGIFDGTVLVQVSCDGAVFGRIDQMMRALVFARACALGIIKPEDADKK